MAVTIRNNTKNGDMWNEWATILNAAIFDSEAQQNQYDDILKAIANVSTSSRWGEKATTIGGLGDYDVKTEGENASEDTFVEGYSKFIQHYSFAKTFLVSKEMVDDNQIEEAKAKAVNLVQAYKRSQAKYLTQALTTSVGSTKTMTFGGQSNIDISGADNKALFASDHPLKNSFSGSDNVTQTNLFTNALGNNATMLNKLANIMRNFKDDRGEVMGFTADTIIIPGNQPVLEDTVKKIIGSDGEIGTSNNDINTQRGKWKLVVDYLWTPASGSPYIIMSSEANKELLGTRFFNRTGLDVENEVKIESRNLVYNGFARWSAGFTNWRHVLMGGSSDASATTLN
jgi:phage major head subunit gpT-like protein